jgi:transcriptional regulator with XRE-family HTH domain
VIAPAIVDQVRDLLAAGAISQRKIAQRVGVSRGMVNAIARGKRPDYAARQAVSEADFTPPSGPPVRCPQCGGMVQMPCLVCYVRAIKQQARLHNRQRMGRV